MPRMRPRSVIRGDGADSGVDSGVDQGAGSGVGAGRLELPAHLTRLRLACCNSRLVQDTGAPASSKLATFAETLDELLANRHKVPVFSQVVKHLKLVEEYLAGAGSTRRSRPSWRSARVASGYHLHAANSGEAGTAMHVVFGLGLAKPIAWAALGIVALATARFLRPSTPDSFTLDPVQSPPDSAAPMTHIPSTRGPEPYTH